MLVAPQDFFGKQMAADTQAKNIELLTEFVAYCVDWNKVVTEIAEGVETVIGNGAIQGGMAFIP